MSNMTREQTEAPIQEVLEVYPENAKKERAKHLTVNDQEVEQSKKCITSNRKSLPGVMTIRGCAYAGSKGVVWGPIKDMIHVSHGPVGCGQYSRAGRRNYYVGTTGVNTFGTMNFTSDFQEKDIVFGGDKKLDKLITDHVNRHRGGIRPGQNFRGFGHDRVVVRAPKRFQQVVGIDRDAQVLAGLQVGADREDKGSGARVPFGQRHIVNR